MSENTVFVGCGVILLNSKGQFLMMKRTSKHGPTATWRSARIFLGYLL